MDKSGKKSGTCTESQLIDCIADKSYKSFVAYQTDCFISGHNTDENLGRIEVKKLLEIRLFNEKEEVMARRTMIGINNPFQWRVANEDGLSKEDYIERLQTLDIDTSCTQQGDNGNLCLTTTGGGKFELPIRKEHDSIKIISYIGYDDDGMAYIYDDRLAGFVTKGGKVDA